MVRRLRGPWRYAVAVLATALTFAVQLWVVGADRPFLMLFVFPAALAAYAGGLAPAVLSISLSAVGAVYLLIPPYGEFTFRGVADVVQWVLFCGTGLLVAWVTDLAYGSGRRSTELEWKARQLEAEQRSADALREREQRLQAIFDNAAIGIFEVDEQGRIVSVNERFCRLLGYDWDELLRRTLEDVTAPEDRDLTRALHARGRSGELPMFDYEKRYLRRDGSRLWGHATVSVVRDEAGRYLRAVVTAEDISDRKRGDEALRDSEDRLRRANEQLRDAARKKDEFLGMLSHELRNPLAPIRNSLFILDRVEPSSAQAHRARQVATRQVGHLARLVDDLLDVTRIARGKIELRREGLDLADLVRHAAEDQRELMDARHLWLAVDVPAEPVPVVGDRTRLAQVLGNLLHNAAKFTPADGHVTLSLRVEGASAVVRVRDTGAGIGPDVMETLFEPFTQAKQTLARSEGGLGLGLALVKGLVELHAGEVSARSAGAGQGTEFTIALPVRRVHVSDAA